MGHLQRKLRSVRAVFPLLLALTIALTGGPTRAQTAAAEKPPSVKPLSVKPMYGMSLYGDLKYPEGFRHFDYVKPDAPKGGTVKLASPLGTFDSLNPFILRGVAQIGRAHV